jgi:hypothetical protein
LFPLVSVVTAFLLGWVEIPKRDNHGLGPFINLPDWVDDFAKSFADMIVQGGPEEEQLELAEYAVERLRYFIAECRNEMAEEGGHA